jgi:serine protease SohB
LEYLAEYGLFFAKIVTVLAGMGIVIALLASTSKAKTKGGGHIEVVSLNDKLTKMEDTIKEAILPPGERKNAVKERKKKEKLTRKKSSKSAEEDHRKRVFVLNFHGDLRASRVAAMRNEITAILAMVDSNDEVVVNLESSGGMVHGYGLAASQLDRIKQQQIPLTICIDKVAASGGYMMACVADKIIAAPFAIVGSIGVVAQIPNIHKLLKRHDIDVELMTAGKYKRTLTVLGENTDEDRDKFREDLEEIHTLFKEYVSERRSKVDIEQVATGEVWYGSRALNVGLVDDIKTSDEYLSNLAKDNNVFEVHYVERKTLPQKLGLTVEETGDRLILRWLDRLSKPHHES